MIALKLIGSFAFVIGLFCLMAKGLKVLIVISVAGVVVFSLITIIKGLKDFLEVYVFKR